MPVFAVTQNILRPRLVQFFRSHGSFYDTEFVTQSAKCGPFLTLLFGAHGPFIRSLCLSSIAHELSKMEPGRSAKHTPEARLLRHCPVQLQISLARTVGGVLLFQTSAKSGLYKLDRQSDVRFDEDNISIVNEKRDDLYTHAFTCNFLGQQTNLGLMAPTQPQLD